MKQDKSDKMTISQWILRIAGISCILIGGIQLVRIFVDYQSTKNLYSKTIDSYVESIVLSEEENVSGNTETSKNEESEEGNVLWYDFASVDLEGLCQINPDIVGWIFFENEDISYPVLFSGDNETYLRTTYEKKKATAGSIFLEGKNTPDFSDSHSIIYGHNMRNLTMFGKLKYYKNDPDYLQSHAFFQIITKEKMYRYQIFAYHDIEIGDPIYTVVQGHGEDFAQFVDEMIVQKSDVECHYTAGDEDRIITLSTCSKDKDRFVVSAVLVDEKAR